MPRALLTGFAPRLVAPLAATVLIACLLPRHEPRQEAEPPKQPSEHFHAQRAWPNHDFPADAFPAALQQARQMPVRHEGLRSVAIAWQEAGPTNVGGRITAIATDPFNASRYWVGAADGGVLRTTDDGSTWTPLLDDFGGLSIGAMAHHPTQANTLLVGTGEANASGDSYDGIGMLLTTDGGDSWDVVGLAATLRIGKIAWDVTNPAIVHVAGSGSLFTPGPDRGVYRSTDGGSSWAQTLFVSDSTSAIDVVVDPTDGDYVYATMWKRMRGPENRIVAGTESRMWRSTDAGASWAQMTSGVPTGSDVARIGLAVAPSAPGTVYSVFSRYSVSSGTFLDDVYRSTDYGVTWNVTTGSGLGNPYSSFGWYFGQIRVDPSNEDVIFVLGVDLKRSTNAGGNWSTVTGSQHVDFHDLWVDPSNAGRILTGNDGGVFRTTNNGSSWIKSPNLPISQFYAITVDPQLPHRIMGGTQDNSTLRTLTGALDDWDVLIGGDGFTAIVDPVDSDILYGEAQYGYFARSTNGFSFSILEYFGGIERTNWHMPLVMDPNDRTQLYCGTYRAYRTTDSGFNWTPISPDLTDGPGSGNLQSGTLTTLAVAPSDPATLWAGSDDGNVHVTTDGGSSWADVDAGLPVRYVTRVTADPFDDSIGYVTFSGFRLDDLQAHVFRTTNWGASWTDISGNLPDAPVNDLVVDLQDTDRLFVGTDTGVYVTEDLGGSWVKIGVGLPLCVIVDIELHDGSRTLVAGTHGRSSFTLDVDAALGDAVDAPVIAGAADGLRLSPPSPNPSHGATEIAFALPERSAVRVEILDVTGRRIRTLVDEPMDAGRYSRTWDGRDGQGAPAASGVYFARLHTEHGTRGVKISLLR
jgi:photosystem II stability/assembly factor-like uncharacterized protein